MNKKIVGLTAPGQYGLETVRYMLNGDTVKKIIIYGTQRQLMSLFKKSVHSKEQLQLLQNTIGNNNSVNKNHFPNGVFSDPFFGEGGNIFDTIGGIDIEFSADPNELILNFQRIQMN